MGKRIICGVLKGHKDFIQEDDLSSVYPGKQISIVSDYNDNNQLIKALKQGELDNILLLCRDNEHHVSKYFIEVIANIDKHKIVEVGAVCSKENIFLDLGQFVDHQKKPEQSIFTYEFRVFENVKNSFFLAFKAFISTILFFVFSEIAIILFTAFLIFFALHKGLEEIADTISMLTLLILSAQILAKFDSVRALINFFLIDGFWIYYSIPEDKEMIKAMPNGFTTRIIKLNLQWHMGLTTVLSGFNPGSSERFFKADNVYANFNFLKTEVKALYKFGHGEEQFIESRIEGMTWFTGKRASIFSIFTQFNGWYAGRKTHVFGTIKYIRVNKRQYETIKNCKTYLICNTGRVQRGNSSIGVYGKELSQTHIAASHFFEQKERVDFKHYPFLDNLIEALEQKKISCAVIPIFNDRTGDISAHQKIIKEHDLIMIKSFKSKIKYVLAKHEETDTIRYICGHPQALLQCEQYIQDNGYSKANIFDCIKEKKTSRINRELDSSTNAEMLSQFNPPNAAVICSPAAADAYGLKVIDTIELEDNITTFGVFL